MNQFLRFFLPVYFIIYLFFLLVIRSVAVGKKIGKSPVVVQSTDDTYGLIGNFLKFLIGLLSLYVFAFAFLPAYYPYFVPINYLERNEFKIAGVVILLLSFILIFIAQINMRNSFRIGIDAAQKTELITSGLFGYSRNPIYVGMIGSLTGLFIITPNALTLLIAFSGYLLIQIQVRLEEEYLLKMHGDAFRDYKRKVRRLI